MQNSKIVLDHNELAAILNRHSAQGKTIVFTNGCFDLLHVGHIRCLEGAKAQGDILVVALNSDSSVRRLKGKGRPILPEKERAEIIASFSFVDYVTFFDEPKVDAVILALKPHVHAKGSDYTADTVPERDTVKEYGGEIAITGGPKIKSTSEVIQEIASKFKTEEESP